MDLELNSLTAVSAIDGRYGAKTQSLRAIFSEYGLIKYRYRIELLWFKTLLTHGDNFIATPLANADLKIIDNLINAFDSNSAAAIKKIESSTNHDVKAVEYKIKEDLQAHDNLKKYAEFVHFACTSEDINNLAYALMLRDAIQLLSAEMNALNEQLLTLAERENATAMLALTHGQAASPTTLGKEFANFYYRLWRQLQQLQQQQILGKLNGAVGNFNAQQISYPEVNWQQLSAHFVSDVLQLCNNPYTTQIEPHDYIAEILDNLSRCHSILIDLSRDVWGYVSRNYFKQKLIAGEVGSSTMPHKINPIDFENAEGNLGMANALCHHLATKLPISRFQRDLSDSTVLRNLGTIFGYSLIALTSLRSGMNKLEVNYAAIESDLLQNTAVLAEAIQTVMRRYGIENPYEKLKKLTRGQQLTPAQLQDFIAQLSIPDEAKAQLQQLTAAKYIGLAAQLSAAIKSHCQP